MKQWLKINMGRLLGRLRPPPRTLSPDLWGLSYSNHGLCYGEKSLEEVLTRFGSPLHVVAEEKLKANFREFIGTPEGAKGCEVFLSYKTNPVPGLLQLLHQHGAGADVISEYELWLALHLKVPAAKIVYNGPAKSDASLEIAITQGIRAININHWDEVERIRAIARRLGKRAAVGLRITAGGWAGQFGFPATDPATLDIFGKILGYPELEMVGLHCHRGHPIRTTADLDAHISGVLNFCTSAHALYQWSPQLLDLGGSLGIPTVKAYTEWDKRLSTSFNLPPCPPDPQATLSPSRYANQIVSTVTAWSHKTGIAIPQIIIEPGRSLTGNAQVLLCRVVDIKKNHDMEYAILDVGSSHSRIMADEFHQIFPLCPRTSAKHRYRMVGPICHTGDIVHRTWQTSELRRGDALAIMDSGAYFSSDAASFSFARPGLACLTVSGQLTLLRQTETFEYLVGLDQKLVPDD